MGGAQREGRRRAVHAAPADWWRVNVSVFVLSRRQSQSQHFPCGVDECKRVAVGGWKAEL